jgi:hypothetical protein
MNNFNNININKIYVYIIYAYHGEGVSYSYTWHIYTLKYKVLCNIFVFDDRNVSVKKATNIIFKLLLLKLFIFIVIL